MSLTLLSCNSKETLLKSDLGQNDIKIDSVTNKKKNIKSSENKSASEQIIGIWTNQNSENAIFEIQKKTIFYIDQNENYEYSLDKNKIQIKYPDYTFDAEISFDNDTLIMISQKNGQTKYWRFKE